MDEKYKAPESPGNPESNAAPSGKKRGSVWLGFALFWGIAILSYFLLAAALFGTGRPGYLAVWLLGGWLCLPLAVGIGLAIWGRWRTVLGIVLGYACVAALALLLISICTGWLF
jgi:hypothetical protein